MWLCLCCDVLRGCDVPPRDATRRTAVWCVTRIMKLFNSIRKLYLFRTERPRVHSCVDICWHAPHISRTVHMDNSNTARRELNNRKRHDRLSLTYHVYDASRLRTPSQSAMYACAPTPRGAAASASPPPRLRLASASSAYRAPIGGPIARWRGGGGFGDQSPLDGHHPLRPT